MSISSLLVRGLKGGHWVWNDFYNDLQFVSLIQEKKQRRQREIKTSTAVNGLTYAARRADLKFKATVSDLELMEFRHYLKRRNRGRSDSIVTIQDCKIVALFLCSQPLPRCFHKYFNLTTVNQLLRACIVYIQFYLQTCETIIKTQHFLSRNTGKSSENSGGYQAMKEDLDDLRVLIGRFYAAVVFSSFDETEVSQTDEILLFECLLKVCTVVVWIALERKYFNIIKVELERIFRTGHFNSFEKNRTKSLLDSIKGENHLILDGKIADFDAKKNKRPTRLKSNSPVIHNFIRMDEPKLLMIGREDFNVLKDDRLKFLTKYIFVPETKIQDEGVTIGILGLQRRLFDPLLYPCSKRVLKLLITSSPMDVSLERKKLRKNAIKKAQRESEPQPPHIFDELPSIPRPNRYTEEVAEQKEQEMEKEVDETREEEPEMMEEEEEGEGGGEGMMKEESPEESIDDD